MKTTELMTGDWVTVTEGDNEFVGKVQAINTITGYCIVFVGGDWHGSNHDVFIEDMQPIPITPEILDKNGFEQHINALRSPQRRYFECADWNVGWVVNLYPMPNCKYFLETSARMERTIAKTTTAKVIEYVHELQHALKYSEIEKEIVL